MRRNFWKATLISLAAYVPHKANAPEYDRESYGFALGGLISSVALLLVMVILTQAE